jgi:hypothetical protein
MHQLAELPGPGHVRDDLVDETLRVWTVHSYLVTYRPETRPLQIVLVLSGYRDIATLSSSPAPLRSRFGRGRSVQVGAGGRRPRRRR